jgi:hypothetical protein
MPGSARFFSPPQRPDPLRGPPNLLSNGYRALFAGDYSSRGLKLTTHLISCLVQGRWSYTSTPPYIFMAYCLINWGQGLFYLFYHTHYGIPRNQAEFYLIHAILLIKWHSLITHSIYLWYKLIHKFMVHTYTTPLVSKTHSVFIPSLCHFHFPVVHLSVLHISVFSWQWGLTFLIFVRNIPSQTNYRKHSSERNYMNGSQFQFIKGKCTLGFTQYFWDQKHFLIKTGFCLIQYQL